MFWGLVLEPSKKYTQKVDQTFHISQASLDLKSCDHEPIQIIVEYENSSFIIAILSKKSNIFQVPLDLIFKTGDQVSFRIIGNGKVHLSGYHVLEDLDSMIMNGEEESDLEEFEAEEKEKNTKGKGKRKKPTSHKGGAKKARLGNENVSDDEDEDDEDDDENEDDDDDDDDGSGDNEIKLSLNDDDDDDEEEDDDDDDDDEDEDDDESLDSDEDDFATDENEDFGLENNEIGKKKVSKSEKKNNAPQTSNNLSPSKGKDESSQKFNKSKLETSNNTPKSESKADKNKKSKHNTTVNENTPPKKKVDMKNEEKNASHKNQDVPKKVLEGGVIAEELRVGKGPVAKPGKMANVYYVGTLLANKKEFDSVQNGPGFKFRIGRNEVIKGWDIGVNGMKVGGKRRITIPPQLAYGSKGSPPVIPPNSTLVFTVELKGVS